MSRCPTCGREVKRSNEQNARYWLLLHKVAEQVEVEGKQFSADCWHEYLKGHLIGKEDYELPGGEVRTRAISTTKLSVPEFNDYMAKIEHWAGSKHDIWLDE